MLCICPDHERVRNGLKCCRARHCARPAAGVTIEQMDITKVRRLHTTCNQHQANMLLRCGWILLEVKEGKYTLGQTDKFTCPKCSAEIDYRDVHISSWEGLHMVNCRNCGEGKIPYGLTMDEYFVDRITEYRQTDPDEK